MWSALGAAAAGALYGVGEAGAVWVEGRLWLPSPLPLALGAAVLGAGVGLVPGALLGGITKRGASDGVVGAAMAIGLLELTLLVITDAPPFGEVPWYVGSPVALGLGAALILGAGALARLGPNPLRVALALALALVHPLLRWPETPARPAPTPGAKSVVLVTLDTTRADHLGVYGARTATPTLSRLAAEGVLYEAALAPIPVTGPSHTSLMTGLGPWSHGVLLNGIPAPEDRVTMAERLTQEGYRTGAFVSAYVLNHTIGLSRGFATYDDDFSALKGAEALLGARLLAAVSRNLNPDEVLERQGGATIDDAIAWLKEGDESRPYLLWVHLFDPHGPYAPPAPYDTAYYEGDPRSPTHTSMAQATGVAAYLQDSLRGVTDAAWVVAQYDGEISYADAQLGRLIDTIDARGDAGRTIIVVAGDHGESLGEHGVWFNHGDDLYDPSLHVPLVMRGGGLAPGARVPEVVELIDVAPTIYALLGLSGPEDMDGRVLPPTGPSAAQSARAIAFDREANLAARKAGQVTKPTHRMVGLRSPSALFVLREAEGFDDELFLGEPGPPLSPLPEDSVLDAVLAEEGGAATVEALRARAEVLLGGDVARSSAELSPEEKARLEALGYLD
ncbi:MAG: sulfatase [Deltaproteobacteria bacterium]|nr:sulfatase [Deltaproteobacteria bacterium]